MVNCICDHDQILSLPKHKPQELILLLNIHGTDQLPKTPLTLNVRLKAAKKKKCSVKV